MGLLTFALSVTLSKCCDHREMVVDDEMLRYWTRMMDAARAMLFGRRKPPWMQRRWWNADGDLVVELVPAQLGSIEDVM